MFPSLNWAWGSEKFRGSSRCEKCGCWMLVWMKGGVWVSTSELVTESKRCTSTVPVRKSCREGQRAGKPLALVSRKCLGSSPFPRALFQCLWLQQCGALLCSPTGVCHSSRMCHCSSCRLLLSIFLSQHQQWWKGSCTHSLISVSVFSSVWINEIPTGCAPPPHPWLVLRQQLPLLCTTKRPVKHFLHSKSRTKQNQLYATARKLLLMSEGTGWQLGAEMAPVLKGLCYLGIGRWLWPP